MKGRLIGPEAHQEEGEEENQLGTQAAGQGSTAALHCAMW